MDDKIMKSFIYNQNKKVVSSELSNNNNFVFYNFEGAFHGSEIPEDKFISNKMSIPKGIRSYAIYRLIQIIDETYEDVPNDKALIGYGYEIYKAFEYDIVNTSFLKEIIKDIECKHLNKEYINLESEEMRENESFYFKTYFGTGLLADYMRNSVDYGAIRVIAQFLVELLLSSSRARYTRYNLAKLYIGTGDELLKWKLEYKKNLIIPDVRFISLDPLDYLFTVYKRDYPNLKEESIKSLATAKAENETFIKSKQLMNYLGRAMSLFGVLEKELNRAIIKSYPEFEGKKLMYGQLVKSIESLELLFLDTFIENLPSLLNELRIVRNKAAHGEFISYKEYKKIEEILFDYHLLKYIDWQINGDISKEEERNPLFANSIYQLSKFTGEEVSLKDKLLYFEQQKIKELREEGKI